MTQKHQRSRARRYSSRKRDVRQQIETECLICKAEIKNRGSELCDECERDYLGRV